MCDINVALSSNVARIIVVRAKDPSVECGTENVHSLKCVSFQSEFLIVYVVKGVT